MCDVAEFTVPSPDIRNGIIQTRLFWPRALNQLRSAPVADVAVAAGGKCALVVHQYSVMGGSQELMRGIARSFVLHHGITACTLNLRGVGGSSGMPSFTGGAEVADVAAVGAWLEAAGFTSILLVCSSAGGPIGGSALDKVPAFTGYVALGYVFGWFASILFSCHYRAVLDSKKPKLFIQGDRDEFTSASQLKEVVRGSKSAVTETHIIPGVSHFQLEGSEWDRTAAEMSVAFARRVAAWGDMRTPQEAQETASTPDATR